MIVVTGVSPFACATISVRSGSVLVVPLQHKGRKLCETVGNGPGQGRAFSARTGTGLHPLQHAICPIQIHLHTSISSQLLQTAISGIAHLDINLRPSRSAAASRQTCPDPCASMTCLPVQSRCVYLGTYAYQPLIPCHAAW